MAATVTQPQRRPAGRRHQARHGHCQAGPQLKPDGGGAEQVRPGWGKSGICGFEGQVPVLKCNFYPKISDHGAQKHWVSFTCSVVREFQIWSFRATKVSQLRLAHSQRLPAGPPTVPGLAGGPAVRLQGQCAALARVTGSGSGTRRPAGLRAGV